ncbi:cytochrome bd-type quinol oxidase subunit 2 [Pseudomonas sp. JAI111]|jgi:cytochrome bd-type quinol oxidase subunit 2|uniref:hypothetical protein n=1 Tax=unclassified Pseudomonas TaxID=196821 RepID=UPI0021698FDF|nr:MULTISPECIES: hypothetical protein [unclassified Pseudomonas]MCS3840570.1 cytochrome bd-type quinol oxidase subunit 2 [Pseudomonas sp. JAI111]
MFLISMLLFFVASAGMWIWIVKSRGPLNIWLANLGGAVASFIVGTAVLILCSRWLTPDTHASQPTAAFALYTLMAFLGALSGTWLLVITRFNKEQSPAYRHLAAVACSLVTALIALVVSVTIFPLK